MSSRLPNHREHLTVPGELSIWPREIAVRGVVPPPGTKSDSMLCSGHLATGNKQLQYNIEPRPVDAGSILRLRSATLVVRESRQTDIRLSLLLCNVVSSSPGLVT